MASASEIIPILFQQRFLTAVRNVSASESRISGSNGSFSLLIKQNQLQFHFNFTITNTGLSFASSVCTNCFILLMASAGPFGFNLLKLPLFSSNTSAL